MNLKNIQRLFFVPLLCGTASFMLTPQTAHAQNSFSDFELPPEQIVFDLYVAGQLYGNVLVTYTNTWVEVENPQDIVDQMPTVVNKAAFIELLTGRINVPEGKFKLNVGRVTANPSNFSISIEIDRNQVVEEALQKGTVAAPTRQVALRNNFTITGRKALEEDFGETDRTTHTISHSATLSKGRWRARFSGNASESQKYDFGTYSLEHDVDTRTYSAGFLTSDGTTFAGSQNYFGFKLESNYEPKGNLDIFEASPVEIYVPSRARVNIYRNETDIIYSDILDFGFHQVNTRNFPTGSYDLRVEIIEDSGNITEERRLFSKSSFLTPRDHPEYVLNVGISRDGEIIGDDPILYGAMAWRVLDESDLKLSFYSDGQLSLFEPRLRGEISTNYDYSLAFSFTNNSDMAFKTNINYFSDDYKTRWSLGLTHMISGHEAIDLNREEYDSVLHEKLANARTSFSSSISRRFDDITLRYSANFNDTPDEESVYSHGPSISWNAFSHGAHRITTNARLLRNSETTDYAMIAQYRFIPRLSNWSATSNIQRLHRNNEDSLVTLNNVNYTNQDYSGIGTAFSGVVNQNFGSNSYQNGLNLSLDHENNTFGMEVDYTKQKATGGEKRENINYTLNSGLSIVKDPLDKEQSTAFDVSSIGNNVVLELKGNATETEMDILANGRVVRTGYAGETVSFNVPNYETTEITIRPTLESSIVTYEDKTERATLYPENIFKTSWRVDKMILVLGRLIDLNGNPVEWQRIRGVKNFSTTDAQGNFQLELLGNETLYVEGKEQACTVALPNIEKDEAFKYIGDIACI